jgi:outer membrane protein OmpA-like peptidoglycan-associated protein
MNKLYFAIILLFLGTSAISQTRKFQKLYEQNSFEKLQKTYNSKANKLKSEDLIFFANALYYRGDYTNAKIAFDKADSLNIPFDAYSKRNYSHIKKINSPNSDMNLGTYFTLQNKVVYEVENLNINSEYEDFAPTIFENETYLTTSRPSKYNKNEFKFQYTQLPYLKVVKIDSTNSVDIKSSKLPKNFNGDFHNGPFSVSYKNDILVTTRNYAKPNKSNKQLLKLVYYTKDENNNWIFNGDLPFCNKSFSVQHPSFDKASNKLYFSSDMEGGEGGFDIYYSIWTGNEWTEPVSIGNEINTIYDEVFPFISFEGHFGYSSNHIDNYGGLDMVIYKDNKNILLSKPINSEYDDFAILYQDNSSGMFSSNRKGPLFNDDVMAFKAFENKNLINCFVYDDSSKELIDSVFITIVNQNNGEKTTHWLQNKKMGIALDLHPDSTYIVYASKGGYFDNFIEVDLQKNVTQENNISIYLNKKKEYVLLANIRDAKLQEFIEDVDVKVLEASTEVILIDSKTDSNGMVTGRLTNKSSGDIIEIDVYVAKEGYFPKKNKVQLVVPKTDTINLSELLSKQFLLDKQVDDLAKMIQINPINFDLNKFDIRKDAAIELDKIVDIMNEYPNMVVELGSHTDCRASKAYNLQLSDKRAKASANYIKSRISNPDRIYGKGYGESILLNDCACEGDQKSTCDEEQHAANRRTEFKVVSYK